MNWIIFYTTLLFLIHRTYSVDSCTGFPVTDQTYECNAPGVFTASQLPSFPSSGTKKVTILYDVQILDYCGADRPISLMQLKYYSDSNAQSYNGIDTSFSWDGSSYAVSFQGQTPTTTIIVLTGSMGASSAFKDQWFAIFASIDLEGQSTGWGISSQTSRYEGPGSVGFPSDAIFDSHTVLTLCPDVKCHIRNVQIIYDYYNPYPMGLAMGTLVTKLGRYPLTELSGNLLNSDLNTMGQAYFGSDSTNPDPNTTPTWSNAGSPGISFTSTSQYVSLPYFPVAISTDTQRPITTFSMTITLWMKISETPTASNYVFRYSSSDLSTDKISVKVTTANRISTSYRGGAAISPANVVLTVGDWAQVTITVAYYRSQTGNFMASIIYWAIGSTWNYGGNLNGNPNSVPVFDPTDKIRIGGFIGEIGEFSIYSPGSPFRQPACNPTTCSIDLGFNPQSECIWKVCPSGSYKFMSGCLTCPEGCTTCSSAQKCLTCSAGYGLSSDKCTCTVSNCDICTVSGCSKCLPGFDLVNNQCLPSCGDGNYRDTDNTCKTCDSRCSKCTSPTACQACNSPATLNSATNMCECGLGTYSDAGTCKSCPSTCSACTDLATCTECKSGYDLKDSTCVESTTTATTTIVAEDDSLSPALIAVISVGSFGAVTGAFYLARFLRRRRVLKASNSPQTKLQNTEGHTVGQIENTPLDQIRNPL